ncbi:3-isopropylmalate dehydratase small subunit [Jeotgalibacillus proteolyticus]|uniref:3-isopropylmalate dehydratase small subunit n=1 Tax=Jeotgalibacillus proteolyticus TaxID=2082395 RepID=A0A2S5GH46_9BACL|nr:3-isopropylmalate dehydratase small subunit [Jeotgalibacillus proteolyticus]PPA72183.1 3-isopropylmalate dehydratase small subunit [Jeotgalibacillus proteolyticus]
MEPINKLTSIITPLDRVNVDTDQIIPKQFLKRIERTGFGEFLFYGWRFKEDGSKNEDFVLNDPLYEESTILLASHNFGCGSSREHAPWALLDYGFKVVIAPSFADIFYNNCVKNGILPIRLNEETVEILLKDSKGKKNQLSIDLENQTIESISSGRVTFDIDPYWKEMLLNGWDEIALTFQFEDQIVQYEKSHS